MDKAKKKEAIKKADDRQAEADARIDQVRADTAKKAKVVKANAKRKADAAKPKKEKGFRSIMTFSADGGNYVRGKVYEKIPKGHEGYFNEA